jgi:hypothetical protein
MYSNLFRKGNSMKRCIFAVFALLCLCVAPSGHAQTSQVIYDPTVYDNHTRFLVGVTGGSVYSNLFVALNAGVEIPIKNRFELDFNDGFSPVIKVGTVSIPFEEHLGQGVGWGNNVRGGGILWVTKSVGLNSSVEYSNYSTNIYKGSGYAFGGVTLRRMAWGVPARFTFDYVRQFNNGIFPNNVSGTETAHLQGADFGLTTRMGHLGPSIVRMVVSFQAGHVLTQGNPVCDGTFGVTGGNGPNGSCPRTGAWAGGASGGVIFEFPRHSNLENNPF